MNQSVDSWNRLHLISFTESTISPFLNILKAKALAMPVFWPKNYEFCDKIKHRIGNMIFLCVNRRFKQWLNMIGRNAVFKRWNFSITAFVCDIDFRKGSFPVNFYTFCNKLWDRFQIVVVCFKGQCCAWNMWSVFLDTFFKYCVFTL